MPPACASRQRFERASVRASQALSLAGVDVQAKTIHGTLKVDRNGHDGDGWAFLHNAGNPLPYRFVVVDESSMIDTSLMADLIDACGRTRLNEELPLERLVTLIQEMVEPESWRTCGGNVGAINQFADVLVVTQTRGAHEQIWSLLEQLRVRAWPNHLVAGALSTVLENTRSAQIL